MVRTGEGGGSGELTERVVAGVRALPPARYLLAVSGGRDSMVLLDAFARFRSDAVAAATFDHGTGPAAARAARLVEREGARRSIAVVSGRRAGTAVTDGPVPDAAVAGAAVPGSAAPGEAGWRASRWAFLRGWAKELRATVVAAHTRDDQIETVVMRVLRDPRNTSARGLAAMYARSAIARPLLDVPRRGIAAYAGANGVRFLDDPSNLDRRHLRNRVRLDLLPALERAHPGFGDEMIALSRGAAEWRESVERVVDALGPKLLPPLVVPAASLAGLSDDALAILWPAIVARAGLALDWRGTERLVAFTATGRPGGRVQLSGGAEVTRTSATFVVRTA